MGVWQKVLLHDDPSRTREQVSLNNQTDDDDVCVSFPSKKKTANKFCLMYEKTPNKQAISLFHWNFKTLDAIFKKIQLFFFFFLGAKFQTRWRERERLFGSTSTTALTPIVPTLSDLTLSHRAHPMAAVETFLPSHRILLYIYIYFFFTFLFSITHTHTRIYTSTYVLFDWVSCACLRIFPSFRSSSISLSRYFPVKLWFNFDAVMRFLDLVTAKWQGNIHRNRLLRTVRPLLSDKEPFNWD